MLKAMGLAPAQTNPRARLVADGRRRRKISKSTGNTVDPIAVIDEWGLDAFRFYLVRELAIGPDGNWTDAGFQARYQSELANGLGNLLNRSLSMLKSYREGVVPERSEELQAETAKIVAETRSSSGTKPPPGGLGQHLVAGQPRQSICRPDRAVQTRQGPGSPGQTA